MPFDHFIRRGISKYDAVYFAGDNQANNRVRVGSSKTSNRGAFSGSLAALIVFVCKYQHSIFNCKILIENFNTWCSKMVENPSWPHIFLSLRVYNYVLAFDILFLKYCSIFYF